MTIAKKIVDAGIPQKHHDSSRRAIMKILKQSTGKIPKRDVDALIKILAESL
jgi:hypothetical protein